VGRNLVAEKLHQLRYFYRATGLAGVTAQITRKVIAPIYRREVQYILIRDVESPDAPDPRTEVGDSPGTECIVLESPEALRPMESEIPSSFRYSVEEFREHLEQGCVVFLARRPRDTGPGKHVVGYNISRRGAFLVFGRPRSVPSDMFFSQYTEVLPEYRGQRIQQVLIRARIEYCRAHGLKKRCTSVGTENRPAMLAGLRVERIAGTIERVSVLGGLFVWETPWERIEEALRS
jgi:GNAT superfamily N-acetyltransferase